MLIIITSLIIIICEVVCFSLCLLNEFGLREWKGEISSCYVIRACVCRQITLKQYNCIDHYNGEVSPRWHGILRSFVALLTNSIAKEQYDKPNDWQTKKMSKTQNGKITNRQENNQQNDGRTNYEWPTNIWTYRRVDLLTKWPTEQMTYQRCDLPTVWPTDVKPTNKMVLRWTMETWNDLSKE